MFDKDLVDMIHIDVDRMNTGNMTTLHMFDLGNGLSKIEMIHGGSFEENANKIAKTILSMTPVQVIFDTFGLGSVMKDSIMQELNKLNGVEITESGIVRYNLLSTYGLEKVDSFDIQQAIHKARIDRMSGGEDFTMEGV